VTNCNNQFMLPSFHDNAVVKVALDHGRRALDIRCLVNHHISTEYQPKAINQQKQCRGLRQSSGWLARLEYVSISNIYVFVYGSIWHDLKL